MLGRRDPLGGRPEPHHSHSPGHTGFHDADHAEDASQKPAIPKNQESRNGHAGGGNRDTVTLGLAGGGGFPLKTSTTRSPPDMATFRREGGGQEPRYKPPKEGGHLAGPSLHTAAPRGLRGLCCPRKDPTPTPGNRCSSPYTAAPRATHVSHWDEGIGQLLNATFPVEPGQEREAEGHVEQHGNTHVGLPGRGVPTGVGGQRVSTDGLGAEKRVGEETDPGQARTSSTGWGSRPSGG